MTNLEQAPDESFSTSSHQPDGTLGNDESNAEGGVAIIGLGTNLSAIFPSSPLINFEGHGIN